MTDGAGQQNIQVAVRGRPLLDFEDKSRCVDVARDGAVQVGRNPGDDKHLLASACPRFVFDRGFGLEATQEDLFEWIKPAIDGCFEGYNAAVMAYGQTGSGKTYSMGTAATALLPNDDERGLVPRAFERIAATIQERSSESEFEMRVSFVEVHDDNVNDLLADPGSSEVIIREDGRGEVVLVGANEVEAKGCDELLRLLERGSLARTTAATRMNATSSRSHAVLTLTIEQRRRSGSAQPRERGKPERVKAKLQLVDLAGSERNKRTGTTGKHFKESVNINQGLLALANWCDFLYFRLISNCFATNLGLFWRTASTCSATRTLSAWGCMCPTATTSSHGCCAIRWAATPARMCSRAARSAPQISRRR